LQFLNNIISQDGVSCGGNFAKSFLMSLPVKDLGKLVIILPLLVYFLLVWWHGILWM